MNPFFYSEEAGAKGLPPLSPAPPIPAEPPPLCSGQFSDNSLDDSEHLFHNHRVSVAALRLLFTFAPECRSASSGIDVHLHRNTRHRTSRRTEVRQRDPLQSLQDVSNRYDLAC